jgi:predicted nucleic acid-binding protein
LFREAIGRRIPLLTTNLIIAEVHRLTLHRAGVEAAAKALDRIGASSSLAIHYATANDHEAALRWLESLRERPTTYTDAVSFSVMNASACTHVLGFDGNFAAAGFPLWRGWSGPRRNRTAAALSGSG